MTELFFDLQASVMMQEYYREEKKRAKVYQRNFFMEFGSLSEGVFSEQRRIMVDALFRDEWLYRSHITKAYNRAGERLIEELRQRLEKGDHLRIWYDVSVNEFCSMLWIVMMFSEYAPQLSIVCGNSIRYHQDPDHPWWHMLPKDVPAFLEFEQPVTDSLLIKMRGIWKEICETSDDLRIRENGIIRSVPVYYFDEHIEALIPDGGIKAYDLWGAVIRKYGDAIPMNLIEKRICHIVRNGRYIVTELPEEELPPHARQYLDCLFIHR
ncbi:MAG: DUF1835 domain-containing protein [Clostridia bacterium]|nr:DUF1835 domain-containing protein [Clostridia bacterium]